MVKLFKLRVAVWGEAGVTVLASHWSPAHILASDWPLETDTGLLSSRNIHSAPAGPRPHRPAKHKESQINKPRVSLPILKSQGSGNVDNVLCSSETKETTRRRCCEILMDCHLTLGIGNCNLMQSGISQDSRGLIWDFPQYNWDRKGSTVESTLCSDVRKKGSLVHQSDNQFVGFSPDKKRYVILFLADTNNAL